MSENYEPIMFYDGTLAEKKIYRLQEVDRRTDELISYGFQYNDETFSLSLAAQATWLGLKSLSALLSWPVEVSTLDSNSYSLSLLNLNAFVGTAAATVQAHLASGRSIKLQINAAQNETELDAIEDNR